MLLNSTPSDWWRSSAAKADMGWLIRDVYRRQMRSLSRFSIENRQADVARAARAGSYP